MSAPSPCPSISPFSLGSISLSPRRPFLSQVPVVAAVGVARAAALGSHCRCRHREWVSRDQIRPLRSFPLPSPAGVAAAPPLTSGAAVPCILPVRLRHEENDTGASSSCVGSIRQGPATAPSAPPLPACRPHLFHRLGLSPLGEATPSARTLCTFGPASFGLLHFFSALRFSLLSGELLFYRKTPPCSCINNSQTVHRIKMIYI